MADPRDHAALARLVTDLQVQGLVEPGVPGNKGRRGGAGPSDHRALSLDGTTVMVPVYSSAAQRSPYRLEAGAAGLELRREAPLGVAVQVEAPPEPRFYGLHTADGTPYRSIALLHSRDVLATTLLQTCIRFRDRSQSCQFCAIEQSLEDGRTVVRKTPAQVAEVAEAAARLDGVRQLVMTTGTPNSDDRGARLLAETAAAVKARVNLPIQAQCEPPEDPIWYQRMKDAGVDSLGMHLEVVEPDVRRRILPGKAELSLERYFEAFAQAVAVFGRGEVSTYLLAGLGDSAAAIVACSERLIAAGVYPFVVPFVPISGTPLEHHPAPSAAFMVEIYTAVAQQLAASDLRSAAMSAGCAKCGACSALSLFEQAATPPAGGGSASA
ncbi:MULTISPECIES: MSMEG_0568 family radical SAM protein [unclassified Synechococcus]|uniref:MSMEG_0568 family radical SAM protein n=1 Tax=unclassified Synechococcus TaxID=2626047 RepID=UPI0021A46205|nr:MULTISPECIES: MSMEG_0568 family radical SAM protein [unclassified Synechococcus]MCT0212219.1 MSMEG_0568 family radical SAM protein [Synechococcus sp. CS-1326]MCT0234368.1 MSMEG_0568 family radical SAM protein [Synechococcus sp. CS-1327]